jgi:hypothetical protein
MQEKSLIFLRPAARRLSGVLTSLPAFRHAAAAAEASVLRFIQLTYLLIIKEHCWVARKSVIKYRISADARFVVSYDGSSGSSSFGSNHALCPIHAAQLWCLHRLPCRW